MFGKASEYLALGLSHDVKMVPSASFGFFKRNKKKKKKKHTELQIVAISVSPVNRLTNITENIILRKLRVRAVETFSTAQTGES